MSAARTTWSGSPAEPGGDAGAATVLLVHGSWHGSWCWQRVVPVLRQQRLRVVAVDLPSCGRDVARLADLDGDTAEIASLLDRVDGPVVVCAHSYGGAAATAAAAGHGQVRRLVYLSAFMLDVGESCSDIAGGALPGWCIVHDDGTFIIDPRAAAEVLYGDCDAQTVRWATSRLVPQLTATSVQTVTRAAWRTIASTYIVCTLDRAIDPAVQRRLAVRASQTVELESSHSPFLSRPVAVASLIGTIARAA